MTTSFIYIKHFFLYLFNQILLNQQLYILIENKIFNDNNK